MAEAVRQTDRRRTERLPAQAGLPFKLTLEELEPRIAPTTLVAGQFVMFTDSDSHTIFVGLRQGSAGSVIVLDAAGTDVDDGAFDAPTETYDNEGFNPGASDIGSITFVGANLTTELLVTEVSVASAPLIITATPAASAHYLYTNSGGNDISAPTGSGGVLIDGTISAPGQNVGRILIDGTVHGNINIGGSIEVLEMGFLAGTVTIRGDVGVLHIQTNAGLADGTPFNPNPGGPAYAGSINVWGLAGQIDIAGINGGYNITEGAAAVPGVATRLFDGSAGAIVEAERVITDGLLGWCDHVGGTGPGAGLMGRIGVGAVGADFIRSNDTFATAQFVPGWGGNFTIFGRIEGPNLDVDGDGTSDSQDLVDFYAFPAMPGQVVTFASTGGAVGLFSPTGTLVATSNWGVLGAPESFTVETPGLYRIAVATDYNFATASASSSGVYTISVSGSTPTYLGAVTGATSFNSDLTVMNFGNNPLDPFDDYHPLGGVYYSGEYGFGTIRAGHSALTDAGIVEVSAAALGNLDTSVTPNVYYPQNLVSYGHIGRVAATGGFYDGYILVDGGVPNDYDLQVVNIGADAGHLLPNLIDNVGVSFIADGNIGTLQIGGTLYPTPTGLVSVTGPSGPIFYLIGGTVRANADHFGAPGYIDVLSIGGDFGALSGGDPYVGTGVGGNVRFVTVGGNIYVTGPSGTSPISPIVIVGGGGANQPTLITDDSGGGMQMSVGAGTTLTYRYIPIRDAGPGIAVTSMVVNGNSFNARVSGAVEVGEINVTAVTIIDPITLLPIAPNFRFSPLDPSGEVDIYHLAGDIGNFANSTYDGDLVFATIGNADSLSFTGPGGDIGITQYNTGAVITPPGVGGIVSIRDQVPVRGVLATGNLVQVTAAGAIRDLMATGFLGTVRTNSDGINTAAAQHASGLIPDHVWNTAYGGRGDGATGVFYGAGADPTTGYAIVSLDVGAGLGQVGSGSDANSGVFSPGIIGTVRATGAPASFIDPAIIGTGGVVNVLGLNSASIFGGKIEAGGLTDWMKYVATFSATGNVGTVHVTGPGATIDGTWISGFRIDRVIADGGSNGINDITVFGFSGGLNLVQSDGPGISNSRFQTDGPIGSMVVTSPAGAFFNNQVQASTTLKLISAPFVTSNYIDVFLTTDTIKGGTMSGNLLYSGGLKTVSFTGDISGNTFNVAGPVGTIKTSGGMFDSFLLVTGPFGDVGTLSSYGQLAGAVDVQGNVGTLSSAISDLTGDMVIGGNVNLISLPHGTLASNISIGGNLNGLKIAGDLGVPGGVFAVGGNLGRVTLGSRTVIADINSDLLIGGNMAGLTVNGGMNGNLFVGGAISGLSFGDDVNTVAQHMAVAARLDYAGDVDFYSFDATLGQNITIATNTVGHGVAGLRVPNTVIGLYGPGGVFITVDDDSGPGADSLINFAIPATGTYYVAVANWPDGLSVLPDNGVRFDGAPQGDTGPYTLTIDGSDAVGGAFEPRETYFFPLNNGPSIAHPWPTPQAQNLMGVAPFTAVGPVNQLTIGGRTVAADLNGDALFEGGVKQMTITGSFNSDMTVLGNLSSLSVATVAGGNLGGLGDSLTVTGSLGKLTVGGRGGVGVLNSDLVVGAGMQQMTITGTVLGNIDVTGTVRGATVTGDLGGVGTHMNVTGDLTKLTVGARGVPSDLLSDLNVTGKLQNLSVSDDVVGNINVIGSLQNLTVTGDVWGDIDVGGALQNAKITGNVGVFGATHVNVGTNLQTMSIGARGIVSTLFSDVNVGNDLGRLTAGPIWGDIVVTRNVQQVSTTSGVVPVAVPPPSYIFAFDNGLDPTGSLTAFGQVRTVKHVT
jgi:hypothetical protein